jgi:hypothetical protein
VRIEVATQAMAEACDDVRCAAARLGWLGDSTSWRIDSGDLAADDAVHALGAVVKESLEQLERVLRTVALVVDVAAADYARAEARAGAASDVGDG